MITEVATLEVKPGLESAFENNFDLAASIISGSEGYLSHELLLVRWETLDSHTVGFRKSPKYEKWKDLLHHYYDQFPTVEHFEKVHEGAE